MVSQIFSKAEIYDVIISFKLQDKKKKKGEGEGKTVTELVISIFVFLATPSWESAIPFVNSTDNLYHLQTAL